MFISVQFSVAKEYLSDLFKISNLQHMAENAAPNSTSNGDATRGVPYYEKLKRDLRDTLTKKRLLDKNLVFDELKSVISSVNSANFKFQGYTRRSDLPLRSFVSGRDWRRQYHQRIRQLHQRHLHLRYWWWYWWRDINKKKRHDIRAGSSVQPQFSKLHEGIPFISH